METHLSDAVVLVLVNVLGVPPVGDEVAAVPVLDGVVLLAGGDVGGEGGGGGGHDAAAADVALAVGASQIAGPVRKSDLGLKREIVIRSTYMHVRLEEVRLSP